MVTRKDVAQLAGVSTAVVSYVVNNGPRRTSPETRRKVLQAIEKLGYRPNNVARSLKTKSTKIIGLIIPDSSNAFFSEVAKGIEDQAYDCGYSVMLCNTAGSRKRQEDYINTLISQMVDGMIFITASLPMRHLELLHQYRIPTIVIDAERQIAQIEGQYVRVIRVDSHGGGRAAGLHLIERGHRRMSVIAGAEKVSPAVDRVAGFREALASKGLSAKIIWAGDHPANGYEAATSLLRSRRPPSAIFACNDLLALGVLRAARDAHISVPEELAVIGFDDIDIARFLSPRLTTVQQPKYTMGKLACDTMLGWIKQRDLEKQEQEDRGDYREILLETRLVVREST